MSVKTLGVPAEYEFKDPTEKDFFTNCYVAPGFDSLKLLYELKDLVNQPLGSVEQTYSYLIDQGAMEYISLTNQEDYLTATASMPLAAVAEALLLRLSKISFDQHNLDILALGSGQAKGECRLVQILRKRNPTQKIRLFLFDISSHLLWSANNQAKEIFASDPHVQIIPIQGNFHQLNSYTNLLSTSAKTNRILLVTMLGGTWGNLDHEADFLRYKLGTLPMNSIFLVDMMLCFAPANQPEEILKQDPRLQGERHWQQKVCTASILAFRNDIRTEDIQYVNVLDNCTATIPNSYVVEMRAIIRDQAQLTMHRFKRYDLPSVGEFFSRYGWDLKRTFPYWKNNTAICLFQRKQS